ncbi:MAG: ABC transporter ATP-binding protein [Actinobacteria bacterium]|nr:ABC transporter ATP-binding protein [Actinomycetota bacterium]
MLSNVNLEIPTGDFLGIIGSANTGKSTLTYAINGIIPHYYKGDFYGAVEIDGRDTIETSLTDISRLVGSVCQDIDSQMVSSVVEDELLYGLENFGFSKEEIDERIQFALGEIGIEKLRHRNIASLSGGQKQKVALAAIIALKPKILVLDEPTSELDPKSSRQVFEILKQLSDHFGITIVIVEQKIMLLCEFARSLVVVGDGGIVLHGSVEDVLKQGDVLDRVGVNSPRVATLSNRLNSEGLGNGEVCKNVPEARAMIEGI